MAKERDFFSKVFHPYAEIQANIATYKVGSDVLLKALIQLHKKFKLLSEIRDKTYHLKETIENLDDIDNAGDLTYLFHIEPELEGLIKELDRLQSLFNYNSVDINKFIFMVEDSHRINLRTFI
jgi:hypothetical protein